MAQIKVIAGEDQGSSHRISGDVATIGRHPDNDVIVNDAAASRFHAKILQRGDKTYIIDLESTHGTFVNDVRNNHELLLANGDRIRIGATEMIYLADKETGDAQTTGQSSKPRSSPTQVELADDTVAFTLPAETAAGSGGLSQQYADRLTRVADAIQSVFELDDLLNRLLDTIFDVFRPERGTILLRSPDDDGFKTEMVRPIGAEISVSSTIIDYVVSNQSSLLISDMAEDERFAEAQSVMAQSILSAICSPLVSRDKVLGVLYIDTQSHLITYKREDLSLLNIIAANAAISIENAILIQEKVEAERLAAIGVAVAGISHYAKNILAGIMGSTSLIEMGLDTDNMQVIRDTWPILKRSNKKITALIQDMLSYSKPREPHWDRDNLNTLLREIYDNQSQRAVDLGVELALELDENLPDTDFDKQGLHDTLLNLAGNAIEACETVDAAKVTLKSASLDNGRVSVWVIDNGMGIPEQIAKKIFEPFFSTKGSKGTGLGLAVARKTIQEHTGELILKSQEGVGTTFQVILPKKRPPEVTAG